MVSKGKSMTAFAFERSVDVLEQQTKDYWQLSSSVLGRLGAKKRPTCSDAIERTNKLEFKLNPNRPLLRSVKGLSEVIIEGKRNKKNQPATITILTLQQQIGA